METKRVDSFPELHAARYQQHSPCAIRIVFTGTTALLHSTGYELHYPDYRAGYRQVLGAM